MLNARLNSIRHESFTSSFILLPKWGLVLMKLNFHPPLSHSCQRGAIHTHSLYKSNVKYKMTHDIKYTLTQVSIILIVLSCLTASWLLVVNYKVMQYLWLKCWLKMTIQFSVTAILFLTLKNINPAVPVGVKNPISRLQKPLIRLKRPLVIVRKCGLLNISDLKMMIWCIKIYIQNIVLRHT